MKKSSQAQHRMFKELISNILRESVAAVVLCTTAAVAAPQQVAEIQHAAPTPPPIETRTVVKDLGPKTNEVTGTQWSIGEPTDEEQLYLEYINRSRANPPAEGARLAATTDPDVLANYTYWVVNLSLMQSQFNTNPAVPPLAMHAQLLTAARLHSGDMFTNQFQAHTSSDGLNTGQRITAQGYTWTTYGENVFSYAKSPWHGHAGFNVDWGTNGPSVGGMQNPPGHRISIHNGNFREIGVGIVNGVNDPVGPQLVTQDFATRAGATPMVTGVAFYDLNGNSFYDVGEGIGGVAVNLPGSSYYAITADSGGYAVPVTSNGNYAISFSATGLASNRTATVSSLKNVKVDYSPAYSAPVISGPNPASVNQANVYTSTGVGAATGYDWEVSTLAPYTAIEGAENGLANVTTVTAGGYTMYDSSYASSGIYSFHFAHPFPSDEVIALRPDLKIGTNSTLAFSKRLSWATATQVARAQISTNNGAAWLDVWSQGGSGGSGETMFTRVTNSLSAYNGQVIKVRFLYDFVNAPYYTNATANVGLRLDDIAISNAQVLSGATVTSVSGPTFSLVPTNTGSYQLRARARINTRTLPFGPATVVAAVQPPPGIRMLKPVIAGNQVQLDFDVTNYRSGMTFQLYKSTTASGAFGLDGTATIQTITAGSRYRAVTATGGSTVFYKVRGNW